MNLTFILFGVSMIQTRPQEIEDISNTALSEHQPRFWPKVQTKLNTRLVSSLNLITPNWLSLPLSYPGVILQILFILLALYFNLASRSPIINLTTQLNAKDESTNNQQEKNPGYIINFFHLLESETENFFFISGRLCEVCNFCS